MRRIRNDSIKPIMTQSLVRNPFSPARNIPGNDGNGGSCTGFYNFEMIGGRHMPIMQIAGQPPPLKLTVGPDGSRQDIFGNYLHLRESCCTICILLSIMVTIKVSLGEGKKRVLNNP
jgi:hypothetical protein